MEERVYSGLTVLKGLGPIMVGRHGSRQVQVWWKEREAEGSHPQVHMGSRESELETEWGGGV